MPEEKCIPGAAAHFLLIASRLSRRLCRSLVPSESCFRLRIPGSRADPFFSDLHDWTFARVERVEVG